MPNAFPIKRIIDAIIRIGKRGKYDETQILEFFPKEGYTKNYITALTLYDMAKALEKSIQIQSIQLVSKTGGKSGDYSISQQPNLAEITGETNEEPFIIL